MSAGRFGVPCSWSDPVPCDFSLRDNSLYRAHERILEHLNEVHTHDGLAPAFYVEWEYRGVWHHLGVPKREVVGA